MRKILRYIGIFYLLYTVVVLLVLFVVSDDPPFTDQKKEIFMQFLSTLALIATAVLIYFQLRRLEEQNELQRVVTSKSSIQDVNELILDYPETFLPLLYPGEYKETMTQKDIEKLKKPTAAFAILHSLEGLYYMEKSNKTNPDAFKKILEYYLRGSVVHELWGNKTYHAAFTKDFQDIMDLVVHEMDSTGLKVLS